MPAFSIQCHPPQDARGSNTQPASRYNPHVLPINLREFEALAREKLPAATYDYVAGGAEDEVTLRANCDAFERVLLRPRVLTGVSEPDLTTSVLGTTISLPVMLAPAGFHRLCCAEGEVASARAAAAAGTLLVASTMATVSLEATAAAAAGPLWFQLYIFRDRAITEALVRRAERAGYRALCLTVDCVQAGRRARDIRSAFALPPGLTLANFSGASAAGMPSLAEGASLHAYTAGQYERAIAWSDIGWLRSITTMPLVIKGILTAEDASLAVEAGAAAIIVSNHGGRQLDGVPATIDVLEECVEAVAGRAEVYVDGGFRRGADVLKALAFGARAVLVGRPYLWGLAYAGEAGAAQVFELLREELRLAMLLAGVASAGSVPRALVRMRR